MPSTPSGKQHLIPTFQPVTDGSYQSARRKNSTPGGSSTGSANPASRTAGAGKGGAAPAKGRLLTQHTGLPPRAGVKGKGGGRPR
jgi:hypothetical protein